MVPTRAAGPCHPGTYTRYLSACPRRRRRAQCREIGRKNRKGKKNLASQNNKPRARLQLSICLACLASPLPVLPPPIPFPSSPSLPQPKQGPRRSPAAPCRAANCFPRGCFPQHFLFHLVFILPCTPLCGLGQPLPKVGSLFFFVPRPVTSDRLASPRRRCPVPVRCTALNRQVESCLFDNQHILPGETVAGQRGTVA